MTRAASRGLTRVFGGTGRAAPLVALLIAPQVVQGQVVQGQVVQGQDALGLLSPNPLLFGAPPETAMRARVAAEFPDAPLVRFRKIRPIAREVDDAVAFCGQVSATSPEQREQNFHLFLYDRKAGIETVHILGSESLNNYRVGRKLIGALRRIGCL